MEILLISLVIHFPFFCSWRWSYPTQMLSCDYFRYSTTKFTRSDLGASFFTLQSVFDSYKAHFSFAWDMWLTLSAYFSYKRKDWEHIWPVLEYASIVGAYKNIITICLSSHIFLVVLAELVSDLGASFFTLQSVFDTYILFLYKDLSVRLGSRNCSQVIFLFYM